MSGQDELVSLVATAVRESGLDPQACTLHDVSVEAITADIAVRSDDLESLVVMAAY